MNDPQTARLPASVWVLLISGVSGFLLGALAFGKWQVAVESGQVLAGLVEYPPNNPFHIYHVKLWTLANQIAALLLHVMDERTASVLISGVLGMISFQALALFVYALSSSVFTAVAAPFFILLTQVTGHGLAYPIVLMGTEHTYGVLGLGCVVLTLAAFGARSHRLGGFLLGLSPAVHASLGVWLYLIVSICLVWDRANATRWLRNIWKPFLAGFALCIVSFLFQLAAASDVPPADPAVAAHHLSTFVRQWDGHRMPVSLVVRQLDPGGAQVASLNKGFVLLMGTGILCFAWLRWFKNDLTPATTFLLRALLIGTLLGGCFIPLSWLDPANVPAKFLVLMPSRLANLAIFTFVVLLIGLMAHQRDKRWVQILLLLFLLLSLPMLLVLGFSNDLIRLPWVQQHVNEINLMLQILQPWNLMIATTLLFLLGRIWMRLRENKPAPARTSSPRYLRWGLVTLWSVWIALAVYSGHSSWRYNTTQPWRDRTNDPLLAEVARRPGLLLTGGSLHFIQLWTRRPVLLDGGALDMLPYALEGGTEMVAILREAYGIDFEHPPQEAIRAGAVPHNTAKAIWETWPPEKWRQIKHQYNVTGVLASADWRLQLPAIIRDDQYILYDLP